MKYYLLKWPGKRLWFCNYGPIGPRMTDKRLEAMKFATKKEAMQEDVYSHPICLVEVREYKR